jgi:hypothetical protein
MNTKMTWKRDGRGRQVSTDGRYAVQVDGWKPTSQADQDNMGVVGGEWAAVDMSRPNDNMDWFPTMRDAKDACQRDADRKARA